LNREDPIPVEQALSGDFPDGKGGEHKIPDRIDFIPHPWPEHGKWMLSQMQRWSQLPGKVDYMEVSWFSVKWNFPLLKNANVSGDSVPRPLGFLRHKR
jgi:hypothetical protein